MNGRICKHGVHERMHCEHCDEESMQDEIARLRAEVERLKTVPMKYRRMKFNAQLQNENERLSAEVEELRESERGLRVMNDGLAKWKDELKAEVEELRKFKEEFSYDRERLDELKNNQLKPGEVRAKRVYCYARCSEGCSADCTSANKLVEVEG